MLIANTSGDRLFDWHGNFNPFLVPFNSNGGPTIIRSQSPHTEAFLYALGAGDGADRTLSEPYGELGLVDSNDKPGRAGPSTPQPIIPSGEIVPSGEISAGLMSATAASPDTAGSTGTPTAPDNGNGNGNGNGKGSHKKADAGLSTPSIDWTGSSADVTVLPWAQSALGLRPVGLSVPWFDVTDEDDELIDWTALDPIADGTPGI